MRYTNLLIVANKAAPCALEKHRRQPPRPFSPSDFLRVLAWLTVLLTASACSLAPAGELQSIRIVVAFREPVDGASSEILAKLAGLAGTPVRYAAPVSPARHAYILACPARDPRCDAAMRSLSEDSSILSISPDQLRKTH